MKRIISLFLLFVITALSACTPSSLLHFNIVDAVQFGSLEAVKEAVESGADVNTTFTASGDGIFPHEMSIYEYALWEEGAFAYGQIADYLLESGADPNVLGPGGFSPLMNSAGAGDILSCKKYIQCGADVNLSNQQGRTALDEAAYCGESDAIQFLLDNGAFPTSDSLQIAVEYHNYGAANLLAKELQARGIDTKCSPCVLAAMVGDSQGVIQNCKNTELTAEEQTEAIYYVAAFCTPEALSSCISHGFDLVQENETYHPLEIAADYGNLEMVRYLLEQYPDITKRYAKFALKKAAKNDDLDMVRYLLDVGTEIIPSEIDFGPVDVAARHGNVRTLEILLHSGQKISHETLYSALQDAGTNGQVDAMRVLLQLEIWSADELTTIWEYCILPEQRELCLIHGANPTAKTLAFWLSLAVEHGDMEMVKYLLSKEADPSILNEDGSSSLDYAVMFGFYDIAELLIEHGADVNYINEANANCSVLHVAAMSSTNLTRLLVEHGAQVNVQTTQGDTPLMYAVESGKPATVAVLLQAGADANIQNKDGKTARELAEKSRNEEMMALFS